MYNLVNANGTTTATNHKHMNTAAIFRQQFSSPLLTSSTHSSTPPTPFSWKGTSPQRQFTRTNHYAASLSKTPKEGRHSDAPTTPNLLFGSKHAENDRLGNDSSPKSSLDSPRGLGYFAFPPTSQLTSESRPTEKKAVAPEGQPSAQPALQESLQEEEELKEELRRKEADEARRLQLEEEARRGEEAWVRSGGVLRDARGLRDMKRTASLRAELKLRDWEAKVSKRWKKYEESWKYLLAEAGTLSGKAVDRGLAFQDIPWPVYVTAQGEEADEGGRDVKLDDLTSDHIEAFFLEPLKVRGSTITKKERVRSALLRWHPDKMTGILNRVAPQDAEDVRAGVRIVVECLQRLNMGA